MITVPSYFWEQMLLEFSREPRQVEQVCYFDGVMCGDVGVMTTLTFPNAQLHSERFEVPPEAMSQAGKHLRAHRLRRLAQVHTHPAGWVGHSPWDDLRAYSQQTGAVSVVLPHFARMHPSLGEAGIHLRTDAGWTQISDALVPNHIRIVPSLIDFRPRTEVQHDRSRIEPTRRGPWRTLLTILGLQARGDYR